MSQHWKLWAVIGYRIIARQRTHSYQFHLRWRATTKSQKANNAGALNCNIPAILGGTPTSVFVMRRSETWPFGERCRILKSLDFF
jgi:hypothetical protein